MDLDMNNMGLHVGALNIHPPLNISFKGQVIDKKISVPSR